MFLSICQIVLLLAPGGISALFLPYRYNLVSSIDLIERPSVGETTVEDLVNDLGGMLVTLAFWMSRHRKRCSPPDAGLVLFGEVPDASGEGFPGPPTLTA